MSAYRQHCNGLRCLTNDFRPCRCLCWLIPVRREFRRLFIAETTCEYYPVPVKDFVEIADEKHLWRDISNILMYRIAFMTNRDRNLIGQDAYSQIKALLLELWSYPESSRFEINAQNFIQQRTGLSRSRIMQVLSELKAGDYIKILHGRLLELRNLPVSF